MLCKRALETKFRQLGRITLLCMTFLIASLVRQLDVDETKSSLAVENIEIYNEPNLDATRTGCANVVNTWLDDLRIRSTALQVRTSE